jgi:hypothetical protein
MCQYVKHSVLVCVVRVMNAIRLALATIQNTKILIYQCLQMKESRMSDCAAALAYIR